MLCCDSENTTIRENTPRENSVRCGRKAGQFSAAERKEQHLDKEKKRRSERESGKGIKFFNICTACYVSIIASLKFAALAGFWHGGQNPRRHPSIPRVYMLWFNFILGLNLFHLCFKLIIINYHSQKQRKRKFKPRIKLNHNIYIQGQRIFFVEKVRN